MEDPRELINVINHHISKTFDFVPHDMLENAHCSTELLDSQLIVKQVCSDLKYHYQQLRVRMEDIIRNAL